MNEDYLWNRTGKTDEEVEELEQALGQIKYQPRQLEIPIGLTVGRKSWTFRALAIAATIAMLMLGAGVWRSRQESPVIQANNTATSSTPDKSLSSEAPASIPARSVGEGVPTSIRTGTFTSANRRRHVLRATSVKHERLAKQGEPKIPANELAEAQAAKQQLMLALRVVSAKLTIAQKRTQGANPANQVQNQHKIG